jgi:DNA polymerase III subunit epsilon
LAGRHKAFIRPDGWSVVEHDARAIADGKRPASEINGLTDAFLMEHGVPVADVLALWNRLIDQSYIVAAFNAQFDCKMMRAELRRAGLSGRFEETRYVCLMKALDPYGAHGLSVLRGFVKLSEACEFFGIVNEDAHDAMADAKAAQEILAILIRDGRLPEARVYYAA